MKARNLLQLVRGAGVAVMVAGLAGCASHQAAGVGDPAAGSYAGGYVDPAQDACPGYGATDADCYPYVWDYGVPFYGDYGWREGWRHPAVGMRHDFDPMHPGPRVIEPHGAVMAGVGGRRDTAPHGGFGVMHGGIAVPHDRIGMMHGGLAGGGMHIGMADGGFAGGHGRT